MHDRDQEADGGARRAPRRPQDGPHAETKQAAMQRLRLDIRNGGQRLKGKQTTTRVESDPAQTLPEMPHEVCETVAEAVALPLVDGERAVRRVDDRERGRARMNPGPAQFFEL